MTTHYRWLLTAVGSLCSGCGGGDGTGPNKPPTQTVIATIGPEGGEVTGAAGSRLDGVRLKILPGALTSPVTITLAVGDSASFASAVNATLLRGEIAGPVVKIFASPAGAIPATLTLPYYKPALLKLAKSPGSLLVFGLEDDGTFHAVGDTLTPSESEAIAVDSVHSTVMFAVGGFTTFSTVIPRSPLQERVKGEANVGCNTIDGQLTATILDDQQALRLHPRTAPVSLIVLHSTASGAYQTLDDVLAWGYSNDQCKNELTDKFGWACNAHYYIGRDGELVRLVDENYVAYHAVDARQPPSFPNANNVSIGIELFQHEPNGVVLDTPPFTSAQYATLRSLLRGLRDRYPTSDIEYHRVIDPRLENGVPRRHDPTEFDGTQIQSLAACPSTGALPSAPTGLQPATFSANEIDLTWTDNASNEAGFHIERAPGGTTGFVEIATVGSNVTTYRDAGLTPATSYVYRVRAYNSAGASAYSNTLEVTTPTETPPPAHPSGLMVTPVSASQIDLTWTDNASNEDGFRIERAPGGTTTFAEIATVGANVTSFQNTGLTAATSYVYRVRAYNIAGASAYSNAAQAATPSEAQGAIAFVTTRDGNYEIYTVNPDGSGLANLTNNPADDISPAWSPDGSKIAFSTSRYGDLEIVVANSDGSGIHDISNRQGWADIFPTWSPDGSKLAFDGRDFGEEAQSCCSVDAIFTVNADGTQLLRVTDATSNASAPAWSPDGTRIAFATDRDGHFQIYTMQPDGSGLQRLTNSAANEGRPAWSPDGSQLAFESNYQIYVMNADGTNVRRLTSNAAMDTAPVWSPDGSQIAFQTNRDGDWEVYIMNADGSGAHNLTHNADDDQNPAWK